MFYIGLSAFFSGFISNGITALLIIAAYTIAGYIGAKLIDRFM